MVTAGQAQFEPLLTGKAERIYEVLPEESKKDYATATKVLGERLKPAGRKALSSTQLLRRKQGTGETLCRCSRASLNKAMEHRKG